MKNAILELDQKETGKEHSWESEEKENNWKTRQDQVTQTK